MKKNLRLWVLLSLVFAVTLVLTNSILYTLILNKHSHLIREKEEQTLLAVGKQLAIDPQIIDGLIDNKPTPSLEFYTTQIGHIHHLDFIVVMNMDGIRLTHPDSSKIGQHFEGGDEGTALNGQEHLSISQGTLGRSLRGFVPVFNDEQQIGVVALGITMDSLSTLVKQAKSGYRMALMFSLLIAFIVASLVAFYLKRQLHNLEPAEISRLFEERNAMLNETKDVVVVIDNNQCINLANNTAQSMYKQISSNESTLIGLHLSHLILDLKQIDLSIPSEQLYRQNGQDYLFSVSPITVSNKRIGSIIFLRNATESLFVTDQLANTTAYATALQTQSHEFMNKLHVIYGLVDLNAQDELLRYLDDILTPEKEFSHRLSILVRNPMIAGFLIGEREKFSERKTTLSIDISPEIPYANQNETATLINLFRYLHHTLLQRELPEDIPLIFEYRKGQLHSHYILNGQAHVKKELQVMVEQHYFKHLLSQLNGTWTLTQQGEQLHIHLVTDYREEVLS